MGTAQLRSGGSPGLAPGPSRSPNRLTDPYGHPLLPGCCPVRAVGACVAPRSFEGRGSGPEHSSHDLKAGPAGRLRPGDDTTVTGGAGVHQRSSLVVSERRHDSRPQFLGRQRPSSSRAWRPPAPSRSGSTAPSNAPSRSAERPWGRPSARHEPPPHGTETASPSRCSTTTSPSSRSSSRRVGRTVLGSRRIWYAWRIERQTGMAPALDAGWGRGREPRGEGRDDRHHQWDQCVRPPCRPASLEACASR
jgi:hypothetical protein